jgi:hypothetical protein
VKVERELLKNLISRSKRRSPAAKNATPVKVLGKYVKHHVNEEQNALSPKVRRFQLDQKALGEQLAARRVELQHSATAKAA